METPLETPLETPTEPVGDSNGDSIGDSVGGSVGDSVGDYKNFVLPFHFRLGSGAVPERSGRLRWRLQRGPLETAMPLINRFSAVNRPRTRSEMVMTTIDIFGPSHIPFHRPTLAPMNQPIFLCTSISPAVWLSLLRQRSGNCAAQRSLRVILARLSLRARTLLFSGGRRRSGRRSGSAPRKKKKRKRTRRLD